MNNAIKICLAVFGAICALLICAVLALNVATKDKIYSANIALQTWTQNTIEGEIKFEKFTPLLRSKRIANVNIIKYDWDIAYSFVDIKHSGRKITLLQKNAPDSAKKSSADSTTESIADSAKNIDSAIDSASFPQVLGRVTYSIDFYPAIWSIIKIYIKVLLLCAGLYALFKISQLKETANIMCVSYRTGIALFVFVVTLFVLASVGFIAKINITKLHFYIALIISLVCLLKGNPHKLKSVVAYSVFFAVAVFMAFYCYDYSWDGRAYHQMGIYYLAQGWNPIYLQMEEVPHLTQFLSHQIWVEHYLKFAEITQACVYKAFGDIESGKAINYLFAFGAFCFGVAVLSQFKHINLAMIIVLVFLAVFSPVVMAQIGTYYIDGLLGVAICFIVFAMLNLDSAISVKKYAIFALALLGVASIKLTGIAYAGILGIAYFAYSIYCKNFKNAKYIFASGAISLVLIIICNINPLVTNQLQHGHFGYPLMGKDKIDIITSQQPKNFKDNNAVTKLTKSLFGKTQNISQNATSTFKIPFIKYSDESLGDTDTRVGGFGYFFSGIILLCFAIAMLNIRQFYNQKFIFYFVALLGSVIINIEMWWARYVPQMWLLPFCVIVFSYFISLNKCSLILRKLTILFLVLSFISVANLPLNTHYKNTINAQISNLCADEKIYIYLPIGMEKSFGTKMIKQGYDIEIIDKGTFENLSKQITFYPLDNVLDNYGNNQSFWSANSSCGNSNLKSMLDSAPDSAKESSADSAKESSADSAKNIDSAIDSAKILQIAESSKIGGYK